MSADRIVDLSMFHFQFVADAPLGDKVSKSMSADRISDLPDELLQYLLSFLPTRQAVQTSRLSRRWRHLWKSLDTLDFDHRDFFGLPGALEVVANKVLDLRAPTGLVGLRVSIVRFIVLPILLELRQTGKLGDLSRSQYDYNHPGVEYTSPLSFWKRDRDWSYMPGIHFDNLRSLHMLGVNIMLPSEMLISSCHALEDLSLESCSCQSFNICTDRLKSLSLYRNYGPPKILVSAPSLLSLNCDNPKSDIALENLSSLVRASVNCNHKHVVKILNALHNAKVLEFDCLHLEALYNDSSSEPLTTFHHLKSLTINSCLLKVHARVITFLLPHAPILETLVVDLMSNILPSCKRTKRKRGVSVQKNMPFLCFNHLQVVELRNFGSSAAEVELLKFLSKNMKVAGRITIPIVPAKLGSIGAAGRLPHPHRTAPASGLGLGLIPDADSRCK